MVEIGGKPINEWPATENFKPEGLQKSIFETLLKSTEKYRYASILPLIVELKLRSSVVEASKALYKSGMAFKVFRESTANPEYWYRALNGGFQLKSDRKPSDAISDIFRQGSLYGTECSTAMPIVWYKAILDIMPAEQFNKLFSNIYLMNWRHIDRDLAIIEFPKAADEIPGDARYFSNPDVDPIKPEWQGENVFYLGDGQYYGHGIGITDAKNMIRLLNAERKEGSTVSAYLNNSVKRQDYAYISNLLNKQQAT